MLLHMATQVLRITPVKNAKTAPVRLAAHVRGDDDARPPEALPRSGLGDRRAVLLVDNRRAAEAVVRKARSVKRRGRPGSRYIDVLIAGPPGVESPDRWDYGKVRQWSGASVNWLQDMCGRDAVIHTAALHLDEKSPHVHALVVPAVRDDDGNLRLSWNTIRKQGAERSAGSPMRGSGLPRRATHGPEMSAWQDSYHNQVGRHFGLGRGERGSTRRHAEPDSRRGLQERVRDAERLAQERIAEANRAVDAAQKRERDAEARSRRDKRARARELADRKRERAQAARGVELRRGGPRRPVSPVPEKGRG